MSLLICHRLQGFTETGSAGVVKDATFINCYWPKLDRPTRIFADGSSGIQVMGATPRNVWFPDDVVFLPYYPDALYPAEQAVLKAMPFRRSLVNLTPPEAAIWLQAYEAVVASFPTSHTVLETPRSANLLRHREETRRRDIVLKEDSVQVHADGSRTVIAAGSRITKIDYEDYVAPLTAQQAVDLVDGKLDEAQLREQLEFVKASDPAVVLQKRVR